MIICDDTIFVVLGLIINVHIDVDLIHVGILNMLRDVFNDVMVDTLNTKLDLSLSREYMKSSVNVNMYLSKMY